EEHHHRKRDVCSPMHVVPHQRYVLSPLVGRIWLRAICAVPCYTVREQIMRPSVDERSTTPAEPTRSAIAANGGIITPRHGAGLDPASRLHPKHEIWALA